VRVGRLRGGMVVRALVLCVVALWNASAALADEPVFDRDKLVADLRQIVDVVSSTHPDLSYTANPAEIERVRAEIEAALKPTMNVREAWAAFARLNPIFRDAHVGVVYPAAAFQSYREAGGAVFPLALAIDDAGTPRVADSTSAVAGASPGDEIVSINGETMAAFMRRAMPLMRGETTVVQHLVLVRNFAAYWWTLNAPSKAYEVELRSRGDARVRRITLPVSSEPALAGAPRDAFRFRYLTADVGYLDVRSFDPGLKDAFQAFVTKVFAELKVKGTRKLVVDVRANPGGAHELSDILLDHLTALRTRDASSLRARIVKDNMSMAPQARPGDVVDIAYDEWREPKANANRFAGRTALLIGPRTYSQGIVFSTTFQDFKLGVVAGQPTGAWANQTGQVHMTPLTNTGLAVAAPLYIITRPSGDKRTGVLQPDKLIAEDANDPLAAARSAAALLE
jgi:C-terminal processing protease CtpA/Prc